MGSLFFSDEELGKKDDDRKPTKLPHMRSQWSPSSAARLPQSRVLKRLTIALVLGLCLYLFIHNIPADLPIRDRRRPVYNHLDDSELEPLPPKPKPMPKLRPARPHSSKPSTKDEPPAPASGSYNGRIQFKNLGASLNAISETNGEYNANRNVLFAASSLKSAAVLLPIACQMGAMLRSYVHFALMSRSEIAFEELRAVNGVADSCEIIFHDARVDHSASSADTRLGTAVTRAFFHIHSYMHPQVVIVDGSSLEENFFLEGVRVQVPDMEVPLIELDADAPTQLSWITKLDSASLAAWDKISIDILIQASSGASGSLIRLLKSLAAADYSSGSVPHLTIELPHKVDPPTAKFLETFQWPPASVYNPTHAKQLTLRHRISSSGLTEEESSVRFVESFWPASPGHSHVLVLSPQAELSPRFFHYLKYSVLEYIHSNAAVVQQWDSRLLGISLDLPSTHLNASEPFVPPVRVAKSRATESDESTSFLWQAPNSNAVLYTGHKWVELHRFVSRTLELQRKTKPPLPAIFADKAISKRYPSWLEHALKLSRARGYWTLYPSQPTAGNLAVVHNELYKAPEEYEADLRKTPEPAELSLTAGPLLESLPGDGSLLHFDDMPFLLWDGTPTNLVGLDASAADYAAEFRRAVGGCDSLAPDDLIPRASVGDLFCTRDD
ncbi:hypothetical protein B0T26DRAFT_644426 [Lasiosphaeria miniovina]|uniref:Glycosyltransferase 2 n=1 Tax=Lasiosphaeria miniovina TaxID=1954250 RepID=A0AA40E4F9_9PEZI|nr:uncharacterized protein B0T26DRAFT_644426 [Lasiosphaeria miniovina]KAK0722178.1 hypothetical protein B0T26DRAFT_644426 [Lasiosphaeria miniovina]